MKEPWKTQTDGGWLTAVRDFGWKPHFFEDGTIWYWRIEGDCPRCGENMWKEVGAGFAEGLTVDQAGDVEQADSGESAKRTDVGSDHVRVRCNCDGAHPKRPETEKTGCGQAGNIEVPAPLDVEAFLRGQR